MSGHTTRSPRDAIVQRAIADMLSEFSDVADEHGLTHAEALSALASVQSKFADQAVRAEREAAQANTAAGHPSA